MPVPDGEGGAADGGRKKKRAVLPHERLFLEHLPESDRYYRSFMHRDNVNFAAVTK
jgi:peptidylprolyl isomerase domain and WD repeat-containing protein 1